MSEQKVNPAEKNMGQKKRILMFVSLSFLSVLLCTAVVIGVALSLITEGVYDFDNEPHIPSATVMPENADDTVEFLSSLLANASDDKIVYINSRVDAEIDDDSVEYSGTQSEKEILMYAKGAVLDAVNKLYPEDYSGKFEDGYKFYPTLTLKSGEYTDAKCTEGIIGDDAEISDSDFYFFDITVPGGVYPAVKGSGVYNDFSLENQAELASTLKSELSGIAQALSSEVTPEDFKISAKSDRINDLISSVEFTCKYHVILELAFKGDFASLGTRTLSFDYSVKKHFDYTWAGISFSSDSATLAPGEGREVGVNAVMNDYSDYKVLFESSDESVVSVDDMGYITAHKASEEPVIITVRFSYLGHEYSDTCEVYSKIPVEKIKISDDNLEIKKGGTAKLSAKLSPKNATDGDIIWISENTAVATVSEDGTVSAAAAGEVKIIAVSDDGHFRDSCVVTVTE
ncbi:MAG: hypothetical protein GX851_05145 [Clostridiales bacterium]|nr:hypothetical protein [Clostridiales bacterium]